MPATPWQLWIVIALLGLEGFGNLVSIVDQPIAAYCLVSKVVFITGFLKRWQVVFILFMVLSSIHVLVFLFAGMPVIALLNVITMVLVGSQYRWFFPLPSLESPHQPRTVA